jgi:salicylate 5-hydroxylase large subunit
MKCERGYHVVNDQGNRNPGPSTEWPAGRTSRVPFWVYTSDQVYRREQERIFGGAVWAYVGLAAEIPDAGDFKRAEIGDRPVIVVRDKSGEVHVLENRCAHRGAQFCQLRHGNTREFTCPYHHWTYDLGGKLLGMPFRHGLNQQGGMPADFDPEEHGLRRLRVTERHGVIFASYSQTVEPFEDYLGPTMLALFDRVFDGRPLTLLGYSRQAIPANWKLMFENVKDPYHATLMHVFLITFGLFRAGQISGLQMDATGRHAAITFQRDQASGPGELKNLKTFKANLTLNDPSLLDTQSEYAQYTNVMQTLWPNVIIQQQSNTLATRQLVTRGIREFELVWTFFGYAGDSEALTRRRLLQANLMGPAGFVAIDDSEMMKFLQGGIAPYPNASTVVEMGGRDWHDENHIITEAAIRAFYEYYRKVMEL